MPGGFEWGGVEDLRGRVVGVTRGYSYGEEVDAAVAAGELEVIEVPTVEHLFSMLARGRVELALANDSVGYALARQSPQALIVPASRPTGTDVYYMALSRRSPSAHLMPAINGALAELKREGLIEQVMSPR